MVNCGKASPITQSPIPDAEAAKVSLAFCYKVLYAHLFRHSPAKIVATTPFRVQLFANVGCSEVLQMLGKLFVLESEHNMAWPCLSGPTIFSGILHRLSLPWFFYFAPHIVA